MFNYRVHFRSNEILSNVEDLKSVINRNFELLKLKEFIRFNDKTSELKIMRCK